ncbi:hypothetical protein O6P43_002613 [Quillaja saponaria]|uniref:Uncharacterized protein n=1 Tax=Quillaja saponaria TaxID=32244 RepID=A0AAD7QCU2_QUISA|nr:hypothetical protein O6P43_002613 [Quillaja saponaria]
MLSYLYLRSCTTTIPSQLFQPWESCLQDDRESYQYLVESIFRFPSQNRSGGDWWSNPIPARDPERRNLDGLHLGGSIGNLKVDWIQFNPDFTEGNSEYLKSSNQCLATRSPDCDRFHQLLQFDQNILSIRQINTVDVPDLWIESSLAIIRVLFIAS